MKEKQVAVTVNPTTVLLEGTSAKHDKVEISETYVTAYGGREVSVTTGHPGDPGSNFGALNGYPD